MIRSVLAFEHEDALWAYVVARVAEAVLPFAQRNERAGIFFSGGTTYIPFYERCGDMPAEIFLADERLVPPTHPARTGAMIARDWQERFVKPESTIHQVDADDVAAYAAGYAAWRAAGNSVALALLGLGTDGHTASLFPNTPEAWATDELFVQVEGKQPPLVPRMTATPQLLNSLPRHMVVVTDEAKADIVAEWLEQQGPLPITGIVPTQEQEVILSLAAARRLRVDSYTKR